MIIDCGDKDGLHQRSFDPVEGGSECVEGGGVGGKTGEGTF